MKEMTRRQMMQMMAASVPAMRLAEAFGQPGAPAPDVAAPAVKIPPAPAPIAAPAGFGVAPGPFQPTFESLSNYQVPEWYRDAKFGIWAHWGPQCQPEQGDWYAQHMYQPNHPHYQFHVQKYGHPSKFGFKDVCNEWRAEKWDPVALVALYKKAGAIDPILWQTDTCIGDWHYRRSIFDQHRYKMAMQVVQMLIDIVSKNGNLMLSIPLPGNGAPDEDELKLLDPMAAWIAPNGEAIYGTRPWAVYGKGPSAVAGGRRGMGSDVRSYTAGDFRFTKKGDIVYAFMMTMRML